MRVTRHAEQRTRQRVGLPKRAVDRAAARALKRGKPRQYFLGAFRRYLNFIFMKRRRANNMRVYNGYIYMFDDDVLITVLEAPPKFRTSDTNSGTSAPMSKEVEG